MVSNTTNNNNKLWMAAYIAMRKYKISRCELFWNSRLTSSFILVCECRVLLRAFASSFLCVLCAVFYFIFSLFFLYELILYFIVFLYTKLPMVVVARLNCVYCVLWTLFGCIYLLWCLLSLLKNVFWYRDMIRKYNLTRWIFIIVDWNEWDGMYTIADFV